MGSTRLAVFVFTSKPFSALLLQFLLSAENKQLPLNLK